jgi:hypothetical protein
MHPAATGHSSLGSPSVNYVKEIIPTMYASFLCLFFLAVTSVAFAIDLCHAIHSTN